MFKRREKEFERSEKDIEREKHEKRKRDRREKIYRENEKRYEIYWKRQKEIWLKEKELEREKNRELEQKKIREDKEKGEEKQLVSVVVEENERKCENKESDIVRIKSENECQKEKIEVVGERKLKILSEKENKSCKLREKKEINEKVEGEKVKEKEKSDDEIAPEGDLFMVRTLLGSQVKEFDESQRENIFHTRCITHGKLCSLIIDEGSCTNVASARLVSKLNLETKRDIVSLKAMLIPPNYSCTNIVVPCTQNADEDFSNRFLNISLFVLKLPKTSERDQVVEWRDCKRWIFDPGIDLTPCFMEDVKV